MSDDFFDIGWEEMALAGSLAEEMADEERERRKLEQEAEKEETNCCYEEREPCEPCEPPDPPFVPLDEDPYP